MTDKDINEAQTRKQFIDAALKQAGWGPILPYLADARYNHGCVEEYPTGEGSADYILFHEGKALACVEGKRVRVGPQNVLQQAKRYAREFPDRVRSPGCFGDYRLPFVYSTNGRVIWFQDLRNLLNLSWEVAAFHTPEACMEMLNQNEAAAADWFKQNEIDDKVLWPFQIEAVQAIEAAILGGRRHMLVAMATGTGKTFTIVNLIYRLMKSGLAKRILFLVDRRALAAQVVTTLASFQAEPGLKFDQIYEVYSQKIRREDLDADMKFDPKILPTAYLTHPDSKNCFVYVSTIQRMRINLFGDEGVFGSSSGDQDGKAKHTQPMLHKTDSDLPEGWAVATLDQLTYPSKEKVEPGDRPDAPYLSLEHIESGTGRIVGHGMGSDVKSTKAVFRAGDVLYGKLRPYLNKVCIPDFDGICSTDILVFPQSEFVNNRYLRSLLMLPSVVEYANNNMSGVQLPRIGFEKLGEIEMPLAPLSEQKRIVAKVEALLEQVNAARARLAKLPAILKRFRQSVLTAACSGQRTAEWRDWHPNIEPARALLTRIQSARIRAAETARGRRQVEEAFSEAQSIVSDDEIGIGELPRCWLSCRVGAIGKVLNGSTPSRKHPEYWDGDIAWVSSGEVGNNIITETRERITSLGYSNTSLKLLPSGTVLMAMIGEGKTRGQSAILRIKATINQNIAAVLLSHGLIVPEFLWRWFQFQYEATRVQGGGSGPQALNCQRVRELPFVLPPLDEQREIVRRVEALFALAEGIEGHIRVATVRAERLLQSVLARAFRGELVPTEAELAAREGRDYEPASVLLERIQEERKQYQHAKRGRGIRKRQSVRAG